VRQVEEMVRALNKKETNPKPENIEIPDSYKTVKDELATFLKTNVQIRMNNKGKGSIVIPIENEDKARILLKMLSDRKE
jgi:succinylarginine dihydrolase